MQARKLPRPGFRFGGRVRAVAVEKVELRRPLPAPPEHIWSILRSFDVGWHADVAWCRVGRAKSGALVREFDDRDGTRFREVCTYLSDSDRRLNYRMTAGPAHISSYAAQVCILQSAQGGSEVRWAARDVGGSRGYSRNFKENRGDLHICPEHTCVRGAAKPKIDPNLAPGGRSGPRIRAARLDEKDWVDGRGGE